MRVAIEVKVCRLQQQVCTGSCGQHHLLTIFAGSVSWKVIWCRIAFSAGWLQEGGEDLREPATRPARPLGTAAQHAPLADLGSLWRLLLLSTAESGMHWFSRVDVSALSLRLLLLLTLWAASCGLVGGHMLVVMKAVVAKGHPRGIAPLH